jgi:hypothetical protein
MASLVARFLQVRRSGAPRARTLNPRIKSSDVYGPGGSGNVRDLGRVPARRHPDGSELQPELQPRTLSRRDAARQAGPRSGVDAPEGLREQQTLACGWRWPWMVRCWCAVHASHRMPHNRRTARRCPPAAWASWPRMGEWAAVWHGGAPVSPAAPSMVTAAPPCPARTACRRGPLCERSDNYP